MGLLQTYLAKYRPLSIHWLLQMSCFRLAAVKIYTCVQVISVVWGFIHSMTQLICVD